MPMGEQQDVPLRRERSCDDLVGTAPDLGGGLAPWDAVVPQRPSPGDRP